MSVLYRQVRPGEMHTVVAHARIRTRTRTRTLHIYNKYSCSGVC